MFWITPHFYPIYFAQSSPPLFIYLLTCCNPSSNMNFYIEEPLKFQLLVCDGPIKISHWEDRNLNLRGHPLKSEKFKTGNKGSWARVFCSSLIEAFKMHFFFFKILISLFGKNKKKKNCKGWWWGGVVMVEIMVGIMIDLKTYVDSGGRC